MHRNIADSCHRPEIDSSENASRSNQAGYAGVAVIKVGVELGCEDGPQLTACDLERTGAAQELILPGAICEVPLYLADMPEE